MYRMRGRQFQGDRWQRSLCGVQCRVFLYGAGSYVLQRVRSGLLRHGDYCKLRRVHGMRTGLLHCRYGLDRCEQLQYLRGGLWRYRDDR